MNFIEINAKRVHSNLAFRYFMSYFESPNYIHHRYTINQPIDIIIGDIFKQSQMDAIFVFSAYVWNIVYIERIAHVLKGAFPQSIIIIGGPEVTFHNQQWLENKPFDILVKGEGEALYAELGKLNHLEKRSYLSNCSSVITPDVIPLDQLGIGYDIEAILDEHIVYYESSRGCPYNCSYCISSTTKGVRYKSIEIVKHELHTFINAQTPVIKFIDRTFNAPVSRAMDIMTFLIENDNGISTFHFELSPNLINEDLVCLIGSARPSLFQFEIGLQSAKKDTLAAVGRTFDSLNWTMVKKLIDTGAHVHLDLIAGLPYESFDDFRQSMDAVMALKPNHLQVGVLKLLQGSALRNDAHKFGYVFDKYPPYTFYQNHMLTAQEQTKIMALEEGTERLYNDGVFGYFIKFLYAHSVDVFGYLINVGQCCLKEKASGYKLGKTDIAKIAVDSLPIELKSTANEVIALDFFVQNVNLIDDFKQYRKPLFDELTNAIYDNQWLIKTDGSHQNKKDVVKGLKVMCIYIDVHSFKVLDTPNYMFKFKNSKVFGYYQKRIYTL